MVADVEVLRLEEGVWRYDSTGTLRCCTDRARDLVMVQARIARVVDRRGRVLVDYDVWKPRAV